MKAINYKTELEAKITFLKLKQSADFEVLKQQYDASIESIKPMNLLKSATKEFMLAPDLKSNLINAAIGFGTSYLSKNFMNVHSANPIKRVLGKVIKFTIKNFVEKKQQKL